MKRELTIVLHAEISFSDPEQNLPAVADGQVFLNRTIKKVWFTKVITHSEWKGSKHFAEDVADIWDIYLMMVLLLPENVIV